KENNLIPIILRDLKSSNPTVTIFGTDYPTHDGTCIRDYIHVHDLGTAHIQALRQHLAASSATAYNLGNGRGFSVKEVISAVERVTKISITAKQGKRRPGDPPILVADASKAIQELNWHPRYPSLDEMISHAWTQSNI